VQEQSADEDKGGEIGAARTRAALAINEELIELYWRIGTEILARQERDGWGGKVIDRLASDLRAEFPEMRGLSVRNLEYMRQFAASWPDSPIPPQPVAQLPWGLVQLILHEDYNFELLGLAEDGRESWIERPPSRGDRALHDRAGRRLRVRGPSGASCCSSVMTSTARRPRRTVGMDFSNISISPNSDHLCT
jgi:predicted nuclease of restriction endonuclease-like (RecB) superfamily